uniref:Uncharacterized protein n=1 Tax=Corvus moneduloides TaxID=1196302 RepID=A0A8U7NT20_CORMO
QRCPCPQDLRAKPVTLWGQFGDSPTLRAPGAAVPAVPPPPSPVLSPFQPRPSASLVSPRGDATSPPRCPHPTLALAGWCPLSPAGTQTTQLLVQPPWTPPVLWDRVTLTCQGSGTAAATTWYKDGQRWWLQGPDRFRVTESGTYQCDRPGTGLSPSVSVSNAWLVLQVPARALLEGDTVTLRCRSWQDNPVTSVSFYREEKQLQRFRNGTELSLSPLRLHHSGRYRCRGWVESSLSRGRKESVSAPVTVKVHGEHPTAATLTPRHPHTSAASQPLHSRLGVTLPPSHLLPRALPGAGAGGSPRAHRGVPPQSQLPQHPQPPAAPSPPPAPLLPARAVGGGPAGVPAAPAARRGGLPLGELQLPGALRAGAVRKSSARLRVTVRSECGDGRGEPRQQPRVPQSCLGSPQPSMTPSRGRPSLPSLSLSLNGSPHPSLGTPLPHLGPSMVHSSHPCLAPQNLPCGSLQSSPGLPSMNLPGVPSTPSDLPPHLLAPFFLNGVWPPLPDPLPP